MSKFSIEYITNLQRLERVPIDDDRIYRDLATKAMQELPMGFLKKIFTFERIDIDDLYSSGSIPLGSRNTIGTIKYIATIHIDDGLDGLIFTTP